MISSFFFFPYYYFKCTGWCCRQESREELRIRTRSFLLNFQKRRRKKNFPLQQSKERGEKSLKRRRDDDRNPYYVCIQVHIFIPSIMLKLEIDFAGKKLFLINYRCGLSAADLKNPLKKWNPHSWQCNPITYLDGTLWFRTDNNSISSSFLFFIKFIVMERKILLNSLKYVK